MFQSALNQRYLTQSGKLDPQASEASVFRVEREAGRWVIVSESGTHVIPVLEGVRPKRVVGFAEDTSPDRNPSIEFANTGEIRVFVDNRQRYECLDVWDVNSERAILHAVNGSMQQVWIMRLANSATPESANKVHIHSVKQRDFELHHESPSDRRTFALKLLDDGVYLVNDRDEYLRPHIHHDVSVTLVPSKQPVFKLSGDMLTSSFGNLSIDPSQKHLCLVPPHFSPEQRWVFRKHGGGPTKKEGDVTILNMNCAGIARSVPLVPLSEREHKIALLLSKTKADILLLQEVDDSIVANMLAHNVVDNCSVQSCTIVGKQSAIFQQGAHVAIVFDPHKFECVGAFERSSAVGMRLVSRNDDASRTLGLVAAHLHPGDDEDDEHARVVQIEEVMDSLRKLVDDFGPCDCYVVAGTLNCSLNSIVDEKLHDIGWKSVRTGRTFPATAPTRSAVDLWSKGNTDAEAYILDADGMSDHKCVLWKLSSQTAAQQRNSVEQEELTRNLSRRLGTTPPSRLEIESPHVLIDTGADGVSAFLPIPMSGVRALVKHAVYFSTSVPVDRMEGASVPGLLVHKSDWRRLLANADSVVQAQMEHARQMSGRLQRGGDGQTGTEFDIGEYMLIVQFSPEFFRLSRALRTQLLPIIKQTSLFVKSAVLAVDNRFGADVPTHALNSRIVPQGSHVAKFVVILSENAETCLHYLVGVGRDGRYEPLAMMELDDGDDALVIADVIRALYELHIVAFCAKTSHEALVLHQDISTDPRTVTPSHLASLLRSTRGPEIKRALCKLNRIDHRALCAYKTLF